MHSVRNEPPTPLLLVKDSPPSGTPTEITINVQDGEYGRFVAGEMHLVALGNTLWTAEGRLPKP